jgi:hypothetical protein
VQKYGCPVNCGGQVIFAGAVPLTFPDGETHELGAGECGLCHSEVYVRLSADAIALATARLVLTGAARLCRCCPGRRRRR